jgi:hypothetical protein
MTSSWPEGVRQDRWLEDNTQRRIDQDNRYSVDLSVHTDEDLAWGDFHGNI